VGSLANSRSLPCRVRNAARIIRCKADSDMSARDVLHRGSSTAKSQRGNRLCAAKTGDTVTTAGACSIVALSFHYMMRIRFSGAAWHDAHLVPVIRKLLATLQTNYISAGLLCGSGPGLTWSGSERETELPMPAAEEDIGPFEVRMHDLFSDFNPNLIETRRENCEPDHALLSTAWHRVNIRPSRV